MPRRSKPRKQIGYTFRQTQNGNWQFRVSNQTAKPDCKTFSDFDVGRKWAELRAALLRDGGYATYKIAEMMTLADALEKYGREVSELKRGKRQELSRIRILQGLPIARKPLTELRTPDFAALKTTWLTQVGPNGEMKLAPSTVQKYFALLQHMFEVARTEWGFTTLTNPLDDVKKPRIQNARDRRLSRAEYVSIIREAKARIASCCDSNPYFIHFFRFAIRCPQRKSELLARTWADVNWKECSLCIAIGKDGRRRYAPLLPGAMKTLHEMQAQFHPKSSDLIFPMTANAVDMIWKNIKAKLGIQDLHWHDLRHEGCSQAAALLNFDIAMLQKVSGHKTLSQLVRYVNYNMRDVHDTVRRKRAERAQPIQPAVAAMDVTTMAQIAAQAAMLAISGLSPSPSPAGPISDSGISIVMPGLPPRALPH